MVTVALVGVRTTSKSRARFVPMVSGSTSSTFSAETSVNLPNENVLPGLFAVTVHSPGSGSLTWSCACPSPLPELPSVYVALGSPEAVEGS